ncbi:MAG: hypothetical protein GY820_39900 [Gammaproteobacteria bacterium]|nr:hypothetical protein [Gammaproteobacteria bacterium]
MKIGWTECSKDEAEEMSIFVGRDGSCDGSGWCAWIPPGELVEGTKAKYRRRKLAKRGNEPPNALTASAAAEKKLREGLIDYVGRHDGEEGIDELKYLLDETQWWHGTDEEMLAALKSSFEERQAKMTKLYRTMFIAMMRRRSGNAERV